MTAFFAALVSSLANEMASPADSDMKKSDTTSSSVARAKPRLVCRMVE